jgi:hypothetical protein
MRLSRIADVLNDSVCPLSAAADFCHLPLKNAGVGGFPSSTSTPILCSSVGAVPAGAGLRRQWEGRVHGLTSPGVPVTSSVDDVSADDISTAARSQVRGVAGVRASQLLS